MKKLRNRGFFKKKTFSSQFYLSGFRIYSVKEEISFLNRIRSAFISGFRYFGYVIDSRLNGLIYLKSFFKTYRQRFNFR